MTSKEVAPTQKMIPQPPPPSLFSSLPDEIAENILARVSRWSYPSLSLVSKRFRSLLSSMEIYKTRSRIGANETCVYVYLRLHNHPYPMWFSLWTKPNQTLTEQRGEIRFKQDPNGTSVVPTPFSSSYSPPIADHPILTVGSEIYLIGGDYEEPSSSVRILDCRSHTWRDAPNLTVAREDVRAVLLEEKIYVMGGCEIDDYYTHWFEVFDMKTQSWTALPGPGPDDDELCNHLRENYNIILLSVFEGKLHLASFDKEYTYDPKHGTWKLVREQVSFLYDSLEVWCDIENVTYHCSTSGDLFWSDSKTEGSEIKGLENFLEHYRTRGLEAGSEFDMVNYGGKLLFMWASKATDKRNQVWYAKISLESRCNGREVWGNVECVDVLTFPVESFKSFYCLSASV